MKMKRTKFTTAAFAVLLAIFAAMAFADEAAAKPAWVTVEYKGYVMRTQKGKKVDDKDYYRLVLKFDIINNNKNGEIITAIFDRNMKWSGVFTINKMTQDWSGAWQPVDAYLNYIMSASEVAKGEWYPGQVYKDDYELVLHQVIKPYNGSWQETNEAIARGVSFKLKEWNFDLQVKSKK